MPTSRAPIDGPSVWTGAMLDSSGAWIRNLDDGNCAEIDAALGHLRTRGNPVLGFGRGDFPLERTAGLLGEISEALERGPGAIRLRGLPVGRYGADDRRGWAHPRQFFRDAGVRLHRGRDHQPVFPHLC